MAGLTIELPPHAAQTEFNLRRWDELQVDPEFRKFEGRVETDRHGHSIVTPTPAAAHGAFQSRIACLLSALMPCGRIYIECPMSTADGVKAADVAWASAKVVRELGNRTCFPQAPEICVEVLSESNTKKEIEEKVALYFDAGAQEVWICDLDGQMGFEASRAGHRRVLDGSGICTQFPKRIELPEV